MTLEQIDRYSIKGELGRGGMATVYLAHDPRFGRDVAIKVLPQYSNDENTRGRFQREARTIAALEHQAIVPVYDYGEDNGQLFLVMRIMSGGSLADRIRQGPIPLAEAGAILERIASALDYAHRHSVVHRDLKPGNILFDQQGASYLADFGIAKLLEAQVNFTGSSIIGTPAYISPEQVQGNVAIDGRSDIYSLGAILFEMLTGTMPYKAETPLQVLMQHAMAPPPRIREANAGLPAYIQDVIDRAMAKDPNQRFSTASAMIVALLDSARATPTIKTAPVFLPPHPPTPTTSKPQKRGRGFLIAIGFVFSLLLISAFALSYLFASGFFTTTPTPTPTTALPVAEVTEAPTEEEGATPVVDDEEGTGQAVAAADNTATPEPLTSPTLAPTFTPSTTPTPTPTTPPTDTPTPTPVPPTRTPSPTSTPTIVVPSSPGIVHNFESGSVSWRRGDQPYGELVRSAEQVHGGGSAGKLSYDFPAVANNFVVFLAQPTLVIGGEPTGIRAWIYGDNSGHFLNLWIVDADNEVRQYTFGRISFTGWRQVTAWFDEERGWPNQHISGTDDEKLTFPVRLQAIVLDGSPDEQASTGIIYIDDITGTDDPIP